VQQKSRLFDHLVGPGEQRVRHVEAKRLRGFEVNDQLILGRGLYRHVGRLFTLKDAIDILRGSPLRIVGIRSVGSDRRLRGNSGKDKPKAVCSELQD